VIDFITNKELKMEVLYDFEGSLTPPFHMTYSIPYMKIDESAKYSRLFLKSETRRCAQENFNLRSYPMNE
jgi:hypothetical protein